jgi:hypothetical protein
MDATVTALAITCARLDEKALLPVNVDGDVLEVLISQLLAERNRGRLRD